MALVRLKYRAAPVQPEIISTKENTTLSKAKKVKPPPEDPYKRTFDLTNQDPILLPSNTQKQRTETIILSEETAYRSKQYPTVTERIDQQKQWAEKQIRDVKFAAQKEAIRRAIDEKKAGAMLFGNNNNNMSSTTIATSNSANNLNSTNKIANGVVPPSLHSLDLEMNLLLAENDIDITRVDDPSFKAEIAQTIVDIKQGRVLANRDTAKYHRPYSIWRRRWRAIGCCIGWVNESTNDYTVVLPWLLLGRREIAFNDKIMISLGVTHILNVTNDLPNLYPEQFVYEQIPIKDTEDQDFSQYFLRVIQYIRRVEECKGRIFVHCNAGASRAPTAVMSYLIAEKKIPLQDVFHYLQGIRPVVYPNRTFLLQLAELENDSLGGSSILFHRDWRFYELNTFRAENPTAIFRWGVYSAVVRLYGTIGKKVVTNNNT